jgi:hypothetical protein
MFVDVQPKEIIKSYTVERLDISISDMKLNESVILNVLLITGDNDLLESINLTLTGEDYNNWSNDDNYIVDIVLEKLNMQKL